MLAPLADTELQLQIMAVIARLARDLRLLAEVQSASSPTALLAALRIADAQKAAQASRS